MIYRTSTYYKIRKMKLKVHDIQGGQGAGKNVAIAQILIEDCAKYKDISTVISDTYDNLKDGIISDMKNQFEAMGFDWDKCYNKSGHDLYHNGGVIQFRYVSDQKRQAGKSKRRARLYINEANKIGWEVASTYIGRTHGDVYIDYNPDYEFWAHTELPNLKDENGNIITEKIIVTYLDNEMLPQSEIDYIESRKDNEAWYRVYGLGQTGTYSDRRIYEFKISEIPDGVKRVPSGMDFGFSPDPTCLIDCYVSGADLYVDEVFEENGLHPVKIQGSTEPAIVDRLESVGHLKDWMIIADSAGAREIADIRKYGYNIRGIKKTPGSLDSGIQLVRSYNLFVTPRSKNVIKAMETWFRKVDRNGKITPEPDGHEPDTLAALRYVVMTRVLW